MAEKLKRAQILLEPEQYKQLAELAEKEGKSISGLVREAVGEYLTAQSAETRKQQRLAALARLDVLRERIREEHGVYKGDVIREVREARTKQLDEINELWDQWS